MGLRHMLAAGLMLLAAPVWSQECLPDQNTLCLLDGRFSVQMDWRDSDSNLRSPDRQDRSGAGTAVNFSDGTGFFSLANDNRPEVLVKLIDGRGTNGNFWVFWAAASSKELELLVTDTVSDQAVAYFNPLGVAAATVTDVSAFSDSASKRLDTHKPAADAKGQRVSRRSLAASKGGCVSAAERLCLRDNRFGVEVEWRDFDDNTGNGTGFAIAGDQGGAFSFFGEDNPDMIVNILDGTAINNQFWSAVAFVTDIEVTVRVTDFESGVETVFFSPLGVAGRASFDLGTHGDSLNRGHAGFWFNPDTSGQGLSLELHPGLDNFAFAAIYSYEVAMAAAKLGAEDQRWLSGQGNYGSDTIEFDLFSTTGGRFDDPQTTETTQVGTARFVVEDCQTATLSYELPDAGISGTIPLQRLLPAPGGLVDLCVHLDLQGAMGLR